jgi:predicted hydrolase (HD superfamily)
LLHDADYELTKEDWGKHTLVALDWLKEYEVKAELTNALKSHNNKITGLREPQTLLEWTLECCDELTGFIVAVALMTPRKKLSDVAVDSVLKKFSQPSFARAVDREQIKQCESRVNVPVSKFVEVSLKAMQDNSELLGL